MTIVLLVEGETERALTRKIKEFLDKRAEVHGQTKSALKWRKIKSTKPDSLRRQIALQLRTSGVTAVVALLDVYPQFKHANEAKRFLLNAAGSADGFYAHVAQYDVEAWLLPFWDDICMRIGVKQKSPGHNPEQVNLTKPPSYHLRELYKRAKPPRKYTKTLEMSAILKNKDLAMSANACPELKKLLNTLLKLSDLPLLS